MVSSERVAMVSGAGRGIGMTVARRLLDDGYKVSLGIRSSETRDRLADDLPLDQTLISSYDARDYDSTDSWVKETVNKFGHIDAIVANAGIVDNWDIETGDEATLESLWDTNVKGPWRLVSGAWDYLKESGCGRVVTMGSLSGRRVKNAASTGYAMSKFALMALTHGIRHSGWDYGIRATAVCPGLVSTDMTEQTNVRQCDMTDPETVAQLITMSVGLPNKDRKSVV